MRITFVLPTVSMSGGIRVVAIYAKALADKGHDVFLVSPPPSEKPLRAKIKEFLSGNGWPKVESPQSHLDGLGLNHKVLSEYRQIADDDVPEAEVVVATWWETAEWVAELSAAKGAKNYFIQGYEIFDFLPIDRCKATYRLALHKIVIAQWLSDIMKDEYEDANVDLVPNSVDRNQFFSAPRDKQIVPTVGFLYSHAALKGVDVTLKALEKLKITIPNLRVISFGSYPLQENILWDNNYEFYYSPKQEEIRNLYAQCDVWITASRTEGFNLPAMEAMACRTPVVSTKTGWPVEAIVNGKNGFLTEIDDVDGLVSAINKLLSTTNEEWKSFSLNSFQTVENSSWEASATLFEKALMNGIERMKNGELKQL